MTKRYENRRRKKFIVAGVVLAAIMLAGTLAAVIPGAPVDNRNTEELRSIINQISSPVTPNASALGNPDAKITIVEFGNYDCPLCAQFHMDAREQIISNLVATGRVNLLFKDIILDSTGNSSVLMASAASYCAAEQGKYWEYHQTLFDNYQEGQNWLTSQSLKQFANEAGIGDLIDFSRCIDSNRYVDIVEENDRFAQSLGIPQAPTFIITSNNTQQPIAMPGGLPYSEYERIITNIENNVSSF
jgi:protein-disulfide isomerase